MQHRERAFIHLQSLLLICILWSAGVATGADAGDVVIYEIAWMGTSASTSEEWIELFNTTGSSIDLSGWILAASDGTPSVSLSGTIGANSNVLVYQLTSLQISRL